MAKHIFITGSTDGIGKIAALQLANQGHHVYMHGRNQSKLESVVDEIKVSSNNSNVSGYLADLSDLASVGKLAKALAADVPHLDALVNNAGVFKTPQTTNNQGMELRFAVNYFAPYLLTQALIPTLKKADAPRVINLSSAAQAPVSLQALSGEQAIDVQTAYAQSKLALTMWSFGLASKEKDITVIAVNPGSLLNTNMVKEAFGQHWASAEKGADILCELATAPEHATASGKYFDNDLSGNSDDAKGDFGNAHPDAYDVAKISALIHATEDIVS